MRDIDNYTESALNKKLKVDVIRDYTRTDLGNGITHIRYWEGVSNWWHAVGSPVGSAIIAAVNHNREWQDHYFDSNGNKITVMQVAAKQVAAEQARKNAASAKSKVSSNYSNYSANKAKAQAEQDSQESEDEDEDDAINLNSEGNRLHNEKKYSEAINKYQQAYNTCPDSRNKDTYKNNEANSLNGQGLELWNQSKYAEAAEKFGAAYSKCSSGYSSEQSFKDNRDHAKAKIEEIKKEQAKQEEIRKEKTKQEEIKKEQARQEEIRKEQARQEEIRKEKAKQEAYNKSQVSIRKDGYSANKAKAQAEQARQEALVEDKELEDVIQMSLYLQQSYDSVIEDFDTIFKSKNNEIDAIKTLHTKIENMMDNGYENTSEIVHRFHVLSLRIAREEMRINLIKVIDQENAKDLRAAMMNLIDTEIEVLDKLNIIDPNLTQELARLQDELDQLQEDENDDNIAVDIRSIASRMELTHNRVEQLVSERLAQDIQLQRGGNALELRESLIAPIVETYLMNGMDELLQLRIASIEAKNKKSIKLISSDIVDARVDNINLLDIAQLVAQETSNNDITILPLLIISSNIDSNSVTNHWVGLISEYTDSGVVVSYLDSENSSINGLREYVLEAFQVINPDQQIAFREIEVEQQRYNNCGPELIENVMLYINGSRDTQENALYLHSLLWEQSLISDTIDLPQGNDTISTSVPTNLPPQDKFTTCYGSEPTASYDDLIHKSITEETSLIGYIQFDMENL